MMRVHLHVLLVFSVLACLCPAASGMFEWLKRRESAPASAPPPVAAAPAPLQNDAQFEMVSADDKFLAQAKQMEYSPLDKCHYEVVARLKASCDGLSEEQLAKLGVMLFNCQAEVEGRQTYPCTEEMTIKECTADMDSVTWNAYHLVSNRARSVCYAMRQQLFRRRAEQTVNSLISTATTQLHAMKDLKEGQQELRDLTASSLDKLVEGHSALKAQQGKLYEGQEQLESNLKDNLERLVQEKALIASGQELIAQLIHSITQRMMNVSEHLQIQGSEVQDSHSAIVKDLANVRDQAQDFYDKIGHTMSEFVQYKDQTSQYYSDLTSKLEHMNSTLGVMLHYVDNMQSRFEERLHMIQSYLGWAGLTLTAMWTCIAHIGYFVLCAVLLTFLHCPGFSRVMLLITVPLNAVAEVNQQPALDLCSLSVLLFSLSLGHWFLSTLWASLQTRAKFAPLTLLAPGDIVAPQKQPDSSCTPPPPSSTPLKWGEHNLLEEQGLLNRHSFISGDISVVSPLHAVNDSRSASPTPLLVSNSSLSGRQLCNGTTKTGKVCKKRAVLGQDYCRVHEGPHSSFASHLNFL